MFFYFNLFLSVTLDRRSCSSISISFLTWHLYLWAFSAEVQDMKLLIWLCNMEVFSSKHFCLHNSVDKMMTINHIDLKYLYWWSICQMINVSLFLIQTFFFFSIQQNFIAEDYLQVRMRDNWFKGKRHGLNKLVW